MRFSLDLEDDYLWYNEKTKEFEYNKLKEYNEEFRFSIAHETYTNGLTIREAYLRSGFDIRDSKLYTDYSTDFIAKAKAADGFIFGSPVYYGNASGSITTSFIR